MDFKGKTWQINDVLFSVSGAYEFNMLKSGKLRQFRIHPIGPSTYITFKKSPTASIETTKTLLLGVDNAPFVSCHRSETPGDAVFARLISLAPNDWAARRPASPQVGPHIAQEEDGDAFVDAMSDAFIAAYELRRTEAASVSS